MSQKVCQIFHKIERSNGCNLENNHGIGLIFQDIFFKSYVITIVKCVLLHFYHVQYIEGSS